MLNPTNNDTLEDMQSQDDSVQINNYDESTTSDDNSDKNTSISISHLFEYNKTTKRYKCKYQN